MPGSVRTGPFWPSRNRTYTPQLRLLQPPAASTARSAIFAFNFCWRKREPARGRARRGCAQYRGSRHRRAGSIRSYDWRGFERTLLSYVDSCALGINMDTGAIPDFDVFYDCLVTGFDDVLALAN